MGDDGEHGSRRETRAIEEMMCAGCLGPATHMHGDPYAGDVGCCGGRACCEDEHGHGE